MELAIVEKKGGDRNGEERAIMDVLFRKGAIVVKFRG